MPTIRLSSFWTSSRPLMRAKALLLGSALALGLAAGPALAQHGPQLAPAHVAISNYGATQAYSVQLDKSMIVDLPAEAAEVIVSQPAVAGAIMRTARRAIIQGVGAGETNIFFLDSAGRTISVLELSVTSQPSEVAGALEATLSRVIAGSAIRVDSVMLGGGAGGGVANRVVLSGTVVSGEDVERAAQIATQFAGSPENVANLVTVSGAQQVMLAVTVAEVSRDTARQLGVNLSGTLSIGTANLSLNSAQTTLPNGVGGQFGLGNLQINAAVRALEERGALRILAQPTLTALSGQSADFLAGGEVPYVIRNGDDNTVEFKEYGIGLKFTPVVRSNGIIGLTVETNVTDPQPDGTFTTRRANTSVELPAGMTLAIGGLIEERVRQQVAQLPGFGNVPILGALFRSREYVASQTELVILVTPHLVAPQPYIQTPVERSVVTSDAEAIFLGNLERNYGVGSGQGMRGTLSGSVGFVLD
jgi:pilus assembly protein CpaC